MKSILDLTITSIKMFLRNRQALFFTFFTPVVIMLIFGYIGFDKPQKIDVGLVAENPVPQTESFLKTLREFPSFNLSEGTFENEKHELDQGNRSAVFVIPSDFMVIDPESPRAKTIKAYLNAGEAGEARAAVSVINQILDKTNLRLSNASIYLGVEEETVNAHNLRYIEFLLPGLIALSVMQMSVFSVAFVFTQYKEKGVLKRLAATPMPPYVFVSSNVITRLFVSVLQAAIFIGLGLVLFDAHVVGSYLLLLLVVILGSVMFLGLGFAVSGMSKTVDTVPAIANLVVFPMLFLGGTFIAISNMPLWLQNIAKFLPLTYFSTALREVMTKGAGILDIRYDLLGMFVWGVILIALATYTFSFQEKDNG